MKKSLIKWIILGLALRLIIMPFTVHPDLRAINLGAYLISQKGEWLTFYDYLSRLEPGNLLVNLYGTDLFIYPPLAYLIPGVFMFFLGPFYNFSFNDLFLLDMGAAYQSIDLFKNLFLLKVPYLFFDFLIAFLLYLLFPKKKGETAFKLWMINPLALYATFALGQIDVFLTLMIVAAFYFALKEKRELSVLMLGIGGAFKLFPLLFLPLFALVLEKQWRHRLKLMAIGIAPYLVIIAPYLLFSPMYRQAALLASQTDKMFYMKLPLSGAEYVSLFALGYFLLLFLSVQLAGKKQALWKLGLALLLLFFSVTHYHPQWFLWITPFFVWLLVEKGKKYLWYIAILFGCYLGLLFFFEASLHLGLFAPLAPVLAKSGSLANVFPPANVFMIKSLLRTLFAATSLVLVFQLFKEKAE